MDRLNRRHYISAWLCGSGMLLCLVGYWATRYVPHSEEQARRERELRQVVKQLRERGEERPPLYTHGMILCASGATMLVWGLLMWYRNTRPWEQSGWVRTNEDA